MPRTHLLEDAWLGKGWGLSPKKACPAPGAGGLQPFLGPAPTCHPLFVCARRLPVALRVAGPCPLVLPCVVSSGGRKVPSPVYTG